MPELRNNGEVSSQPASNDTSTNRITYNGSSKVIKRLCEFVNSIFNTLSGKADVDDVPTKTSDLTNDSGFITNTVDNLVNYYSKNETYTQTEVINLISSISSMSFEVVQNLPGTLTAETAYIVRVRHTKTSYYYALVLANNSVELLGCNVDRFGMLDFSLISAIDLSGFTDLLWLEELPTSDIDDNTIYMTEVEVEEDDDYYYYYVWYIYADNEWVELFRFNEDNLPGWWKNEGWLDWDVPVPLTQIRESDVPRPLPKTSAIYLLPSSDPQQQNVYDEYIFIAIVNNYEKIGTTSIDLSNYVTFTDLNIALADYITSTDFQTALADYYTSAEVDTLLADKADTSDIPTDLADLSDDSTHRTVTDTEKSTWNNKSDFSGSYNDLTDKPTIPAAQVNSDWNANSGVAEILNKPSLATVATSGSYNDLTNKPTIPDELADLTDDSTHRLVTDTEKSTWNNKSDFSGSYNDLTNKPTIPSVSANPASTTGTLNSIEIDGVGYAVQGGGDPNVQSDWNQTDNTADDYIKNKPAIPAAQVQSDWAQNDNTALDYIKNKPTIPSVPVTSVNGQTGAVVLDADDVGALPDDTPLFSGDYDDLTNKPTIPSVSANPQTTTGTLNGIEIDGVGYAIQGGGAVTSVNGQTGAVVLDADDVGALPDSTVIPSKTSDLTNDSGFISDIDNTTPTVTEAATRANLSVGDTLKTIIGKIKKFFTDLKTVAFTGSYNDLTDKPTIPTVNNGTLTIQRNSTQVATFTANQSGNSTANISVPTKTSELTNDSGYVTQNTTYSAGQGLVLNGTTFKIGSGTNAHVSQTGITEGYVLITINSYTSWMLSFKVRLYGGYDMDEYIISGYNYGANHWFSPTVIHLSSSGTARNVVFGYTANYQLWVAIPNRQYTGCDIIDVVNGYTQVSADGLFTLSIVSSLPATSQTTVTTSPPIRSLSTGTIGSASAGTAIAADDITSWSAGSVPSASVANGRLTLSAGSAPSLGYTARSIPNISVTSTTVVTGGSR